MIEFSFANTTWLAAAGIAWDISGGIALAKGLILDDDTLRRRSGSYWGSSPPAIRGLVEQRIDAKFGISQLFVGFILQLVSAGGLVVAPAVAVILALPIGLAWFFYRSNYLYCVTLGALKHAARDSSEDAWRMHFMDVPLPIWRSALVQLNLTFEKKGQNTTSAESLDQRRATLNAALDRISRR